MTKDAYQTQISRTRCRRYSTLFRTPLVVGFGILEDMLDGKGEGPAKEGEVEKRDGEEREAEDEDGNSDNEEVIKDSRWTSSTNKSRYSIGSNRYHFFAIFSSNENGVSEISHIYIC
jgi:hypothetical protein